MKIIVAICIYNRFENLQTWLSCWQQSYEDSDAELVIIHNYYDQKDLLNKFKSECEGKPGVRYVPRNKLGFDIGAFQDLCYDRLGINWDYVLWCCDDTIPMSEDFLDPFIEAINKPNCGIAAMKISRSQAVHVRTTGFFISHKIASRLKFPADPVTNKQQCYRFEHRGQMATLTNQIRMMGYDCVQVAPDSISPLWDKGYWRRLDRLQEHFDVFGGATEGETMLFICPIFDKYPQIISSLICQNDKDWRLLIIDDNPDNNHTKLIVDAYSDDRIFYEKKPRAANYGHPHRKWALEEIKEWKGYGYVCVTNPDNYYTPNFIQEIRKGFAKKHTAVAVYPDKMVHSYKNWEILNCRPEKGFLDCGGVVLKKEIACEVGWNNTIDHSADWIFFQEIAGRYSWKNFIPIKGCFFVHN